MSQFVSGVCFDIGQKCLGMPTYPHIPFANLHYRATQRANADDWIKRSGAISNEECHRPAWHTHVLIGPVVAKIPPDIHYPQAGETACRFVRSNKLEIGVYDPRQRLGPTVIAMNACGA